jgi:hypothetical protein
MAGMLPPVDALSDSGDELPKVESAARAVSTTSDGKTTTAVKAKAKAKAKTKATAKATSSASEVSAKGEAKAAGKELKTQDRGKAEPKAKAKGNAATAKKPASETRSVTSAHEDAAAGTLAPPLTNGKKTVWAGELGTTLGTQDVVQESLRNELPLRSELPPHIRKSEPPQ